MDQETIVVAVRSSARETAIRVAAEVVAKKVFKRKLGIRSLWAYLHNLGQ